MTEQVLAERETREATARFPGIPATADGTAMIVYVETRATQGSAAYPITSSTQMGVGYQAAVADGFKNVWGQHLQWMEMESEHSSATGCEGFTLAGGRVTNFTSGQGLILMKEVLYTISGKRLPIVFHIAARALTSHSLNVHAGHDDVMGVVDVGWGMLFAKNVQDAGDLALISRRAAEDSLIPYMNIQDGFLTTHTIENVLFPEDDLIREYLGDPQERIQRVFDPKNPLMSGVVQNQDSYMTGKIAQRFYYDRARETLLDAMEEFRRLTGRSYGLIKCYAMEDAEYAIVSMGSTSETAIATIDHIRSLGYRAGVVDVTAFRPFPGPELVAALKDVKAFSVIERLDVPLAVDNPLTAEIESAFAKAVMVSEGYPIISRIPKIYTGCAGLGSRDVTPGQMVACIRNMADSPVPRSNGSWPGKRFFVLGIDYKDALKVEEEPDVRPPGSFSIRGHSVGGYGSVTTNKVIAKCLGDIFGFSVQASPKYGSEKKGLPTNTYLTITKHGKIQTHAELQQVEFVPLLDPNTWAMGNPLVGLGPGGAVFQHTDREDPEELWKTIPVWAKYFMLENDIRLYAVDTVRIARECCRADDSLVQRFQGIVLLGVFLRVTPFKDDDGIADEELFKRVETPLRYYFGKRGDQVIQDNLLAVRKGYQEVFEVPRSLMEATPAEVIARGKEEWDRKGKDTNAFFI
jgi:pyruvate-ferredoxin/flavodoxin oxidoreductase